MNIAELIAALPEEELEPLSALAPSLQLPPTSALHRMWAVGGLQARPVDIPLFGRVEVSVTKVDLTRSLLFQHR